MCGRNKSSQRRILLVSESRPRGETLGSCMTACDKDPEVWLWDGHLQWQQHVLFQSVFMCVCASFEWWALPNSLGYKLSSWHFVVVWKKLYPQAEGERPIFFISSSVTLQTHGVSPKWYAVCMKKSSRQPAHIRISIQEFMKHLKVTIGMIYNLSSIIRNS